MVNPEALPEIKSFTQGWNCEPYPRISPERPELSVAGKVVVVTGGGTGIGNAIAIAFAKANAKALVIIGRREDRLQKGVASINTSAPDAKTSVFYEVADLTEHAQVDNSFKSIVAKAGKIDILVSSAATMTESGPIVGYDATAFMRAFELNTLTIFNVLQCFAAYANPDATFINISTATAHTRSVFGEGAYNISKMAGTRLADQFAHENPSFHVVHLHPGWVPTAMNGEQPEAPDDAGLPAATAVWLASEEARFLKGKFIWSNWDVEELLQRAEEIKGSRLLTIGLGGVPI